MEIVLPMPVGAARNIYGTYAMVGPNGCFFDNSNGSYRYSRPIASVGIEAAWSEITFSEERFRIRNGVAAMLLAAGASVNHRFQGGGTALVRAIQNDDYEMAKLLIEYCADYRLIVDALGRPIYLMEMSEKMRRLIPDRL